MLMYSTIYKTNKTSDKTIADMITAGFTGQLKGWWNNYLNQEQRDKVLQAVKLEGEQYTQNAVYTLEGLALCNEIKLNQQIKRHLLNERKQLGKFCEQFAFDIPKKKSKEKDYTPKKKKSSKKDYDKWKKKRIEKKLRRAEEGKGDSSKRRKKYRSESSSDEGSSTSEDLKDLQQEDYITSEDECSPCQQGMACEKEDDEDDLFKIYAQFKKLSLNVIDNDKVLDLLQNIKDSEIRAQIIDKTNNNPPSMDKDHITEEIPTKEGSYTMAEVKNLLLERRKMISSLTTINDLKKEVNILKEDILRLKEKNVVIEVTLDAIQTRQDLENVSESSSSLEGENNKEEEEEEQMQEEEVISLAQQDNKTLTTFNSNVSATSSSGTSGIDIDHPMYKEFINFMKSKKEPDNNPTYSSILIDEENTEVFDMNDKKDVILLLEENDHKWRNEPWQIMARYLDTVSYTTAVYKYRMHYEIILSSTGCEFQHFYPTNTKKVYNFFKLIIKKILAPEEWGMSTLQELDYIHPEQKIARTFYTKFWSKLLQKNTEGKIHGQEIIDLINVKINKYYDTATMEPQVIEDLSPFRKITRKLQMKKGLISKSKAIALYMEEVKKNLIRNLDIDIKDDISMASASHTNKEDDTCAAGEGQDADEEIDIEAILRN
ncbi:hypothetical protein H5410_015159 [Solanum commersonii]|uniref:DUF7746 domain-containing protein n=1 Tax=Solanum commersonii TaxID=4109 RepID=A0A9J5ZTM8_SOLCO|nr:hypothetical protein H5410_015159 [Solanum commersonii]